ncbi:MAG: hypothetical protein ACRDRJ_12295 [Streptosporangiaceae bacterium]
MRTGIARVLVTGVAVTAAVAFSATTAFATTATKYTVSPGGKYTASAGKTTLKDNKTGTKLNCKSASAKGVLKKGKGLAGAKIGTITSTSFNKCTGPLGVVLKVKQSGTWELNVTKYSSKNGGVATGNISNVKASVSGTGCSATVTGSTDATYSNKTATLAVKPVNKSGHVLKLSNVHGCFGLLHNGDTSGFTGSYKLKPKQKIT